MLLYFIIVTKVMDRTLTVTVFLTNGDTHIHVRVYSHLASVCIYRALRCQYWVSYMDTLYMMNV